MRVADSRSRAIDGFAGLDVRGKAVLVHTGWDTHWRTDQYFEGHPFLTADAAAFLAAEGAALVGIDSLNIDDTADMARPVHTALLGAGVPVAEHLSNAKMALVGHTSTAVIDRHDSHLGQAGDALREALKFREQPPKE